MDDISITQYGKPLSADKYTIDLKNKTFSSFENYLVLDCPSGWTFKTGNNCTFDTGRKCSFTTGEYCIFKTGTRCTFDTGSFCTFSLYDINTCKFKSHDGISTILDRSDSKSYKLTKELIRLLKVTNG